MNNDILTFSYKALLAKLTQKLLSLGLREEDAILEAQIMLEADLHGVPSHGVIMLPRIETAIRTGTLNPHAQTTIVNNFGAIIVKDYANGPGRSAAVNAMTLAIDKARQFGVGVCLARNTTHWGRAHAYVSRAALQGMLGICCTNAIPTMTAGGAHKAVLGNNPLAIGVPSPNNEDPLVLDMAMSQAAVGKIATMLRENKMVPDGCGVDASGTSTTNAEAILSGAVSPLGAHKGEGLAIMLEFLTSILGGMQTAPEIAGNAQAGIDADATKLFIALDIERFATRDQYEKSGTRFINYLRDVASPIKMPGERGWATAKTNNDSVPLHKNIVALLQKSGIQI